MPHKNPAVRAAAQKRYYQANRERINAYNRERRKKNPARVNQYARDYYARHKNDPEFLERRRQLTLAWRAANPEKVTEYRERPDVRATNAARSLEFQKAHPEQGRAGKRVSHAIKRGILIRPDTCERCSGQGPIEAAHEDYSKPLEVSWLCRSCHRSWDKRQPKLGRD